MDWGLEVISSPTHTCHISPHSTDSHPLPKGLGLYPYQEAVTWAVQMQIEDQFDL